MKSTVAAGCALWMTMAVEMAWPSVLPQGALLLPIACGVMSWSRSSVGLMLTGIVLLLDWIARPTLFPLCPMFVPTAAAFCLTPAVQDTTFRRRVLPQLPAALLLPLLTLFAVIMQILSSVPISDFEELVVLLPGVAENLKSIAMITLPLSACGALAMRIADEFGLRRSFQ